MENLKTSIITAFKEVKKPTPKGPPLLLARKQLERIDFTKAETALLSPQNIPYGPTPEHVEARKLVDHLLKPTPDGMGLVVEVAKLNGALHLRANLPDEGHELRVATTQFLNRLERIGALGEKPK